jgi:hypothetical protein
MLRNISMSPSSPKTTHIHPWDALPPLTAKHRRLDNDADPYAMDLDTSEVAFSRCLQMSPAGSDDPIFPQKLSPDLEPPLFSIFLMSTFTGPSTPTPEQYPEPTTPSVDFIGPGPSIAAPLQSNPSYMSAGMQASLLALKADSHATRLAQMRKEQNDKSTGTTYGQHVNRYERWWVQYQAGQTASIAGWTLIPAFPITTAKVSMFLEYKANREKVSHPLFYLLIDDMLTVWNGNSKRKVAKRPYPTLTWARKPSRRLYLPLRAGGSTMHTITETSTMHKCHFVRTIESRPSRRPRDMMSRSRLRAHKHSRPPAPRLVGSSKSVRGLTDAADVLFQIHTRRWNSPAACCGAFSSSQARSRFTLGCAMLLFSTTTAVRGGSSRILCWSDLFMSEIPMDDVRMGKKVPVSYIATYKWIPDSVSYLSGPGRSCG